MFQAGLKNLFLLFAFVPALVFCSCGSCEKVETDEIPYYEAGHAKDPQTFLSMDQFKKVLSEIPKGSKVIVEQEYRDLLPEGLIQCDYYHFYEPYLYPDTRIDPFTADYLLAHESLYFKAIITSPIIWQRVATVEAPDHRTISLLKRVVDLDKNILSTARVKGLNKMVRISGEGVDPPFSIHRYEISHYQYAAYLNDAKIPPGEVDLFYSLKDPTSKIVYYQGQYRVLKGYAIIPAFNVSWMGAKAYCEHYDMRLPNKEQWLAAAGANDGRPYPWGNQTDFEQRGNFRDNGDGFNLWAPVNAFPKGQSPYGVYNMSGNLYEWLDNQLLLGGCMEFDPTKARLDQQELNADIARNIHDGFRCVNDE